MPEISETIMNHDGCKAPEMTSAASMATGSIHKAWVKSTMRRREVRSDGHAGKQRERQDGQAIGQADVA